MGVKQILKNWKWLNDRYTKIKWRERLVHYGPENPDKTFYVIRRCDHRTGLFSYATTDLGYFRAALERGMIPVVDMESRASSLEDASEVGKTNAWEKYFDQPCGIRLEDIRNSRNVMLASVEMPPTWPGIMIIRDSAELDSWRRLAHQYLRPEKSILECARTQYQEWFDGKRVLGVLARGTDYTDQKPKDHPIQPAVPDLLDRAEKTMKDYGLDAVYLATEDADILAKFRERFGAGLYTYQKRHFSIHNGGNINETIEESGGGSRDAVNRDYMISICILSMCDCLTAGATSGTYGALLLSDGYEYQYVYDIGTY